MKYIEDKRIFIIDILGIIYKLYYIYNNFFFFHFEKYLKKKIINYNPNNLIIVFDTRLKYNYKKNIYSFYKNNRKKNIFIKKNIYKIYKILKKYKIFYIYKKGYEADDLIANYVTYFKQKNYIIYIISNDKDFFKLLSNNIYICNYNGNIIDKYYVLFFYKITSIKKIIDINVLSGDYSDNINGFKNIGLKKSIYFINKYKSLYNILKKNNINNYLLNIILNNKNKISINYKLLSFENINIINNINLYKFNILFFLKKYFNYD
ncbi:MAG: 5'-3' exonuclease H3TH domain-containing protein [Candidatus Shikimatogenerans sp. Tduv]|uniref:5'-3' exonuclease domain-containing protein n=1 Tax=Candidatus Shikimatogenerans sp. Tduv TaxID=3158567 RepID=A0AAU7QR16_9FLAO